MTSRSNWQLLRVFRLPHGAWIAVLQMKTANRYPPKIWGKGEDSDDACRNALDELRRKSRNSHVESGRHRPNAPPPL